MGPRTPARSLLQNRWERVLKRFADDPFNEAVGRVRLTDSRSIDHVRS